MTSLPTNLVSHFAVALRLVGCFDFAVAVALDIQVYHAEAGYRGQNLVSLLDLHEDKLMKSKNNFRIPLKALSWTFLWAVSREL
jgi:hypothetical protein